MERKTINIDIPNNLEIDWDESKKQNKIVLKDKQLTYEEICNELFKKEDIFYIHTDGYIKNVEYNKWHSEDNLRNQIIVIDANNATTKHQLECILAKNKLANVATFLNDGWKPDKGSDIYYVNNYHGNLVVYLVKEECSVHVGQVIFKTKELAQQAIEILGEETVKLALEPLGI